MERCEERVFQAEDGSKLNWMYAGPERPVVAEYGE